MDAVELPLPAKVEFGRIPAAEDGAGGRGGEVSRPCGDADRRTGDVKQQVPNAESCPSYRSKRTSSDLQKSFPPGFKYESNGKREYSGVDTVLSLPKQDGKMLTKKTIKLLSGLPCSKRPKLEQVGTSGDAEAKDSEFAPQKIGPDLMQCTSSEKSRLLKQKRICDGKKIDKKIVRAGIRTKYDCLTSKAGLTNFDSNLAGNGIHGTYGLKSDIRDVTKHMEDLSLSELLDGTYKYSGVGREKVKKALHNKDELLVSVKKICSILSLDDIDSSSSKDAAFILSPKLPSANTSSCEDKDQCSDKSPPSLIKDPSQSSNSNTTLYRPKDVLDRLALSPGQNLDSLLLSSSKSSAAYQAAVHCATFHGASLPPFPWSHSQVGVYRPSVDSSKAGSGRSSSQWQWVRVGCNFTYREKEDLLIHKIDDLLQEMEVGKSSLNDPCDEQFNLCCMQSTPGSLIQNSYSRKMGNEHGPQQLNSVEPEDSSDSYQKYDIREGSLLKTSQASPKVLRAAEILCDMAGSTDTCFTQGCSNGTIKWPKSPSEKAMKACKPSSPFGTAESSSGPRHSDAVRSATNQSMKKIIDRKNDFTRMNSSGKGPIRWPVPIEDGTSPSRSENGPMLDRRQPHGNAARYSSQVSSQARLEKEYENQQKLRKATLTSTLGFTGVSTGDWNRVRNRRI